MAEERCQAQYHIHIDGRCLAVMHQCWKAAGHDMRGWHRNPENNLSWNFDHRNTCPRISVVSGATP